MKFSKLFGKRRGHVYMEPDPLTARRESSPDVHQLRSTRRHHGAGRKAMRREDTLMSMTTIPPSSRVIADEEHPPCVICRAVDFPSLLDWRPGQPRPWVELSHTITQSWVGVTPSKPSDLDSATGSSVSAAEDTPCPYCTFFRLMIGQLPDESGKFTPYLRIRQAFEKLGVKEKAELGKAVLAEVTTKDKDLPWGYILKTADDPTTHEGPLSVRTYLGRKAVLEGRVVPTMLDPMVPKTWLEFCKAHHEDTCEPAETTSEILDLRLINCDTRKVVLASDIGQAVVDKYAALSYVWNGEEDYLHMEIDQDGQLSGQVPQLFADAITITKGLGLQYLWIDKFCMSEDNPSRRRFTCLIGDVFHQAAITLIPATDGTNSIPGVSTPREEQLSLLTDAGLFTTSLLRPDLEIASCAWTTRARTFQEGLFSRRKLVFTPSQCYFQCCHLHCHESIGVSLHLAPSLNFGRVFAPDGGGRTPGQLKDQIRAYIPRISAHPEERLAGFEAVLRKYQQMESRVDELLGIPLFHPDEFSTGTIVTQTDRLAVGLGWMPNGEAPVAGAAEPYYFPKDDDTNGLPSWSWMSWLVRPDRSSTNQAFQFSMVGETSPIVASGVSAPPRMEISVGFEDGKLMSWEIDGDLAVKKKRATETGRILFLRVLTWCFDLPVRELPAGEIRPWALDCNLPRSIRERVLAWYQEEMPEEIKLPSTPIADAQTKQHLSDPVNSGQLDIPQLEGQGQTGTEQRRMKRPRLIGVILSGRAWKENTSSPPSATTAPITPNSTPNTTTTATSSSLYKHANPNGTNTPAFTILICITTNNNHNEGDDEPKVPRVRRLGAVRLSCDGFAPINDQDAILRGIEMDAGEKKALKLGFREVDLW